ncbi:hypothetical protein TWF225_011573 [Orbilia oligospora]|uniref:Uncharacterized protein n=1 Tax=Orbilia oligospora TaxID=2813651 RepID=A0A7C8N0G7_ORBOL|nr:hypothetical protein TWF102_003522 [Orbilia oligospora]KAF3096035.1 hypothetical protein TWF103_009943 [Orbilia oligospora]KAF3131980.1 hypothetical protein TWF594_009685 [Orbilia oligospora]KAF3157366.1 hypothetical protein TWF751_002256 [Orbilia oligospora]KAF3192768.1 hypothetical protein TWF225_011573 [Orbilia oligospora]
MGNLTSLNELARSRKGRNSKNRRVQTVWPQKSAVHVVSGKPASQSRKECCLLFSCQIGSTSQLAHEKAFVSLA